MSSKLNLHNCINCNKLLIGSLLLALVIIYMIVNDNKDSNWLPLIKFSNTSENRVNHSSTYYEIPEKIVVHPLVIANNPAKAKDTANTTPIPSVTSRATKKTTVTLVTKSTAEKNSTSSPKRVLYPYPIFPRQPKRLDNKFPNEILQEAPLNSTEKKKYKKIIYWNDSYGDKFFGLGYGQTPFLIGECKFNNCFTTAKRDRFEPSEVDAILWHFRSADKSLPHVRYPNARYIFFVAESASYLYGSIMPFNNVFDLTFTYRTDSDIPDPYSIVAQRDIIDEKYATGNFSIGKTKMAAWFVSNCQAISGRNTLVETLKKYIPVDVYGKCGPNKCPRQTTESCYKMAAKNYYFYLSFENSLCKDYITEKFFNVLGYDIVPVVYGYGPYWKHSPPHSFIDVFDFPSVKSLADYLIHLTQTPHEYNEYFRWKAYYFVLPMYTRRMYSLCKICEILNTQSVANSTRYNLQDWFVGKSDCKSGGQSDQIKNFIRGENLTRPFNEFRLLGKGA